MPVYGDLARIRTNISAFQALDSLNKVNKQLGEKQIRLATGKRVYSAQQDPAGYVIGTRLEGRARALGVALANVGDGQNLLSTAEGALQNSMEVLMKMKEKVLMAASETLGDDEKNAIFSQLDQLADELDDIAAQTKWNDVRLLDGSFTPKFLILGEDTSASMNISIGADYGASPNALDLRFASVMIWGAASCGTTLGSVEAAMDSVAVMLGELGGWQERLDLKEEYIATTITNTQAAKSRIMDADMAKEQVDSVILQILQQTTSGALVQANMGPQAILGILGG